MNAAKAICGEQRCERTQIISKVVCVKFSKREIR